MKNRILLWCFLCAFFAGAQAQVLTTPVFNTEKLAGYFTFDTDELTTGGYSNGTATIEQNAAATVWMSDYQWEQGVIYIPRDATNKEGNGLKLTHGIAANGTGSETPDKVNTYSMMFDFNFSSFATGPSLFQNDKTNSRDASLFIQSSSRRIGLNNTLGGYGGSYNLELNKWYRVVINVNITSDESLRMYDIYVNGTLVHSTYARPTYHNRESLDDIVLLFVDESRENGNAYLSQYAIFNTTLTQEEITNLGGEKTITIPEGMPSISDDNNEYWYYIYFPEQSRAITATGDENTKVLIESPAPGKAEQLWKVVKADALNTYKFINKNGAQLFYKDGRVYSLSTGSATAPQPFEFVKYTNTTYDPAKTWVLNMVGIGHVNRVNNNNNGDQYSLTAWNSTSDPGNAVQFLSQDELFVGYPKISTEDNTEEYWYYIRSLRAGDTRALQVNTANDNLAYFGTVAKNDDSFLWKVTGTPGNYKLISKDGKAISGITTKAADGGTKDLVIAVDYDVAGGGMLPALSEVDITKYKSEDGVWQLSFPNAASYKFFNINNSYWTPFENYIGLFDSGDGGNPIKFLTEQEQFQAAEVGVPYYIQFQNGKTVLSGTGADKLLRTRYPLANAVEQLWTLSGTTDNYTLENGLGQKIDYVNGKYVASTTGSVTFKIVASANTTYPNSWDLQRNSSTQGMNQDGGAGFDRALAEWDLGDASNALKFILPAEMDFASYPDYMPTISDDTNDAWYLLRFERKNSGVTDYIYVTEMGSGKALQPNYLDPFNMNQFWKLTGENNQYVFTNKNNNTIQYGSFDYNGTSKSAFGSIETGTPTNLSLDNVVSGSFPKSWAIKRSQTTTSGFNPDGGSVPGKFVGEYTRTDGGSALRFVPIAPLEIKLSTTGNDSWFYINMLNPGSYVLEYDETDGLVRTKAKVDDREEQLWKFELVSAAIGTGDAATSAEAKYKLINKKTGTAVSFDNNRLKIMTEGTPATFSLHASMGQFAPAWELKCHEGGTYKYINQSGGAGVDKELGVWNANDQNNPLHFIPWFEPSEVPVLTVDPLELDFENFTIGFTSSAKVVNVSGRELQDVITYSVEGADAAAFTVSEKSWTGATGGTLNVTFKPTEVKAYSATLKISTTGGDDVEVVLAGVGSPLPFTVSTNDVTAWYYLQFNDQKTIIADVAADVNLRTTYPVAGVDGHLWKITEPTSGNYVLVSKTGRKAYLDGGKFQASTTQETAFELALGTSAGTWEFKASTDKAIGQVGPNVLLELVENNASDSKNALNFVAEADIDYSLYPVVPELDTWYYVQFKASGLVLQNMGEGSKVLTNFPNENDADVQQWKLIETTEAGIFEFVSKSGTAKFNYDSGLSRFTLDATNTTTIKLIAAGNTAYKPGLEFELSGSTDTKRYMNIFGGSNPYGDLGVWNYGEPNNLVNFILPEDLNYDAVPAMPTVSTETEEYWYYVKYKEDGSVIQDMGDGENLRARTLDGGLDQMWKLSGAQPEYGMTSQGSRTIMFNKTEGVNLYQASASSASLIAIQVAEYAPYKPALILYSSDEGAYGHFIKTGAAGEDMTIAKAMGASNPLAALEFVSVDAVPALPAIEEAASETPTWYYVKFGDKVLQHNGADENLTVETKAVKNSQLWKFVGTPADFYLESADGVKVSYASVDGDEVADRLFRGAENDETTFALMTDGTNWELKHRGTRLPLEAYYTMYPNANDELGENTIHQAANYVTFEAVTALPSTDATLSSLTVSSGALTPAFDAETTSYSVEVEHEVASIVITAVASSSAATIVGDGSQTLVVGSGNVFDVVVTAEEVTASKTYTITVTRKDRTSVGSSVIDGLSIESSNNVINVSFNGTYDVKLYTVTGVMLHHTTATDSYVKAIEQGVYILTINDSSFKVIVK